MRKREHTKEKKSNALKNAKFAKNFHLHLKGKFTNI
jgi:hypothetical protein